jgi:GntR family transcriptional regulator
MSGSGGGEEGGQDKTEEATARRIEKAREEGQIVMSREVVGFVALGAALVGMMFGLPPLGYELMRGMRGVLENGHQLQVGLVATEMMRLGLLAVLPVMAMAMIGAIAGAMLQSRGLVSAKGLKPQFSRLNPASGIPIYRQLAEQIRRMVAGGQLKEGDELPSVRELALEHAVNPMTISKAYSLLEAEGLLVRQRGKPMQIARQEKQKNSEQERLQHLQPQLEQLVLAARQLEISDKLLLASLGELLSDK